MDITADHQSSQDYHLNMDELFAACISYDGNLEIETFPRCDTPVWILGIVYSTMTEMNELLEDIQSRLWFSYRKNFTAISDAGFTTDKGWGCMLRSGQMVLAEAMLRCHLGRDWRWDINTSDSTYIKIIKMFQDTRRAVYSIHQISHIGVDDGKSIGEWYGPNTIAQVIKKLVVFDDWNDFSVAVCLDSILIVDEIRNKCLSGGQWSPLLLFIPLRLGLSELNSLYIEGLKKSFQMSQSLGVIGGKPNHALYFIGYMGDDIIYLDPHTTQDAVEIDSKATDEDKAADKTYHSAVGLKMPFTFLDPSLALCFCCKTESDFGDLCVQFRKGLVEGEKNPMFEICSTRPSFMIEDTAVEGAICVDLDSHSCEFDDDDEEFEILQ